MPDFISINTTFPSRLRKPSLTAFSLFERSPTPAGRSWSTKVSSLGHLSEKRVSGGRLSAALMGSH